MLRRLRDEEARGGPTLWTRVKHYLYLARLPGVLHHLRGEDRTRRGTGGGNVYWDALDYFARNLRAIADDAARGGIPVLFSVAPSSLKMNYLPEGTGRRAYWLATPELTQSYRDRLALRMRDLVSELSDAGLNVFFLEHHLTPEMFLDDAHLTAAGNRAMAADFVNAVAALLEPRN